YVTKPAQPEELLARVRAQLELKAAISENLAARMHLLQASKLETVGRLAAGLAHEMNSPAQFVADNLVFVGRAFDAITAVLAPLRAWALEGANAPEQAELARQWSELKLDYYLEEVQSALGQTKGGIERIAGLVAEL